MEYDRGVFSIRSRTNPRNENDIWSACPISSDIMKMERLPAFQASSQAKIEEMVDFALSLPVDQRPEGISEWNKLLEEKGIIP